MQVTAQQVRKTVIHEFGRYFDIGDARLREPRLVTWTGISGYPRHRPTITRPRTAVRSPKENAMATESLNRAFESTRAVVAGIGPDQLELPTPCQSWNVAEVINHMNAAADFGASVVAKGDGVPDEQDFAGGDLLVVYDQTAAIALEAFGADGVLEKVATMPFGPIPGGALMMIIAGDQFTHGWDLARDRPVDRPRPGPRSRIPGVLPADGPARDAGPRREGAVRARMRRARRGVPRQHARGVPRPDRPVGPHAAADTESALGVPYRRS